MNPIEKLATLFMKFPGIGPRQAKRFVSYLLSEQPESVGELAELIRTIQQSAVSCGLCGRHFVPNFAGMKFCRVCADQNRSKEQLMVVEKDVDVDHIDRSGAYRGGFFVLGGTIPILEAKPEEKIRINELLKTIDDRAPQGLKEIILALSTNVEGEETAAYLQRSMAAAKAKHGITITLLGRGLSSGAEIEYADMETLKNALKNRSARN